MKRYVKRLCRVFVWLVVVVGVAGVVWLALIQWGSPRLLYVRQVGLVEKEAAKLDAYHEVHGAYPSSDQVVLPSESMFYDRKPDGGYEIGFSVGFDEMYYYDARTGRWSFEH